MAADSSGTTLLRTLIASERRGAERRACRLPVQLSTRQAELRGQLADLSPGGIGFTIEGFLVLKPGADICMAMPGLGEVRGVVRWAAHPRYGAEFTAGTGLPPRLRAFYEGLPRQPGETD